MTKQNSSATSGKKSIPAPAKATPAKKASAAGAPRKARAGTAPANVTPATTAPTPARPGGKLGQIVDRLGAEAGATIEELTGMTGWQAHTVHAALSRLRTRGFAMRLDRDGERNAYRLVRQEG
jgi:hypothetical protein